MKCAYCKILACGEGETKGPKGCPMHEYMNIIEEARREYQKTPIRKLASSAGIVEASGYIEWPRLREIIEFARLMQYKKLGIAFCIGLQEEAAIVSKILEKAGFEVYSINCKVGAIPKEDVGVPKEYQGTSKTGYEIGYVTCNPIGQAYLLAQAGTELNIALGLCVGHDSLFFKYSKPPVTVLAAKDRISGHNPLGFIKTHYGRKYFQKLLSEQNTK